MKTEVTPGRFENPYKIFIRVINAVTTSRPMTAVPWPMFGNALRPSSAKSCRFPGPILYGKGITSGLPVIRDLAGNIPENAFDV